MAESWQDEGIWNPIDGTNSPYPLWVQQNEAMGTSLNLTGWSDTFQGIAKTLAGAYATTTLMEQNQQGQRYLMGQRYASLNAPLGLNSGTLLLIGGGLLLWSLFKG